MTDLFDYRDEKAEMETLVKELNRHRRLYYIEDAPEASDLDYDSWFRRLQHLEQITGVVLIDSSTQQVGFKPSEKFHTCIHRSRMLSLWMSLRRRYACIL